MPQMPLNIDQGNATSGKDGRAQMPDAVMPKTLDTGPNAQTPKPLDAGMKHAPGGRITEHERSRASAIRPLFPQSLKRLLRQGNPISPKRTVFGLHGEQPDPALLKVHIIPAQPEQLRTPSARVEIDKQHAPILARRSHLINLPELGQRGHPPRKTSFTLAGHLKERIGGRKTKKFDAPRPGCRKILAVLVRRIP